MPSPLSRRLSLCCGLLALSFFIASPAAPAGDPPAKRKPVPAKKALADAEKLVREIFQDDIDNAKDGPAKAKLAAALLQQGRDNRKDDLAAAYVLFSHARELAAAAGDYPLAFQAIDELTTDFDLSALDLKAAALAKASSAVADPDANKTLVDAALTLIAAAVDADNYEAAAALGKVAEAAAKKSRVLALVTAVRKRNEEVQAVQTGFSRLQPFIDRLKKDPKDAEANFKLGEYYGLLKGKWDKALPLLALGENAALRDQAKRDLSAPKEGKAQLAVADGWWDLAESHQDPTKLHLLRRAAHWYQEASVGLTGLNRTKALKRLDRVTALVQGPVTVVKKGPVGAIKTLEKHTEEVRCVAFSPDGRHAVSASKDKSAILWDLTTGKEVKVFKGHAKEVWWVAFHPNGRQILTASWDATVKLWDTASGNAVKTFQHPVDVNGVFVTRDGRWMATACDDKNLRLWDLNTGAEVRKFGGFDGYVYSAVISPDGKYIAGGSQDKTVRVYDLQTGNKVREIPALSAPTPVVLFSPDSRHVFSCGDTAAHQYEIATGKEVRRFEVKGSTSYALGIALSPDGRRLLTAGEDRIVRLWDVTTGNELQRLEGHTGAAVCVAFSADGSQALSGGSDSSVRLWGLPR